MPPIVLIISLDEEKYQNVVSKYKAAGGKYKTKKIDGVLATNEQRLKFCDSGCKLFCSDSLVGIFLAHRRAWVEALKHDSCFIYEDDIIFQPNFHETKPLELLASNDIVALGNMSCGRNNITLMEHLVHWIQSGSKIDTSQHDQYDLKWMYGAHGYAISSRSALKLLRLVKVINHHVDKCMTRLLEKNILKGVGMRPSMVSQAQFNKSTQSAMNVEGLSSPDKPNIDYLLGFTSFQVGKVKFRTRHMLAIVILAVVCLPLAIVFFVVFYFASKKKSISTS